MTTPITSIDSVGWYLLSVSSDKQMAQAKEEWGLTDATVDDIVYELNNPPITNGETLSSNSWNAVDTTQSSAVLYSNVGYWVYVRQLSTSTPAPAIS